jgi:hypothetical protein
VTPDGGFGFNFNGFQTVSTGNLTYYLGFDAIIDPAPVLTGDSIGLDPPSGNVTLSLYVCLPNAPYITHTDDLKDLSCGTAANFGDGTNFAIDLSKPAAQLINTLVPGPDQFTTVQFPSAVTQIGVLLVLKLDSDDPASVGAIGSAPTQIAADPESGTWLLFGTGLLVVLLMRRFAT